MSYRWRLSVGGMLLVLVESVFVWPLSRQAGSSVSRAVTEVFVCRCPFVPQGDLELLKQWTGEAVFVKIASEIKQRNADGDIVVSLQCISTTTFPSGA